MNNTVNIFWFRRDLRFADNAGLYYALKDKHPVLPVFVFDKNILDDLPKDDKRVHFIYTSLLKLQSFCNDLGSSIEILHDTPLNAFNNLIKKYTIAKVFTNHDYEPYASQRDNDIQQLLKNNNISFHSYKDQVIFDRNEVLKDDGAPYVVFTPYYKKWLTLLNNYYTLSYPTEKYLDNLLNWTNYNVPSLKKLGFIESDSQVPSDRLSMSVLKEYEEKRDFPGMNATSRIGIHLRFGTISIRELARTAINNSEVYLKELVWREFYQMILWHFPHVGKGYSFKREYDLIQWRNDEKEFQCWCDGKTGYPIVDAGMRQLNETGFMHNRVRMIAASFLVKHLLIDWRWGEAYFAEKLLDFDMAANNGGWQWAAGSGCDAAPYFRIFNPTLQTKRFDSSLDYVRRWLPEFDSLEYPQPIVDHELARKRCLDRYQAALKK